MAKEYVEFKEVVELFTYTTAYDMKNESDIPKVNIIFPESAFKLFRYIQNHPFTKDGYLVPDISDKDIENLKPEKQNIEGIPTIIVKNTILFFELLTDLTNAWLDQKEKYYGYGNGRALFIKSIKRLWLRMSPSDFTNVEEFLKRQLNFLNLATFDEYIKTSIVVGEYEGFKIEACKECNDSWCETNDKMKFRLYDDTNNYHELPSIYFATSTCDAKTICYIYAIQNGYDKKVNKKISRSLYKLNSGVESPSVHPSQVLALKTFIEMLLSIGITEIKVPLLQVLSYPYHELLSRQAITSFPKNWSEEKVRELYSNPDRNEYRIREYEWDKTWYSHVVDRMDAIETAKTEQLYNIFYRVAEQFDLIEILNDPFVEDEYLNIRIKSIKKLNIVKR